MEARLQKILTEFLTKHQVAVGYLFGSQSKGTTHEESDMDIAIVFNDIVSPKEYSQKENEIRSGLLRVLDVQGIDVLNLVTTQDPLLKHNAIFSGQRLVDADQQKRFLLERNSMYEYEDTRHLRETQFQLMKERLEEGRFATIYSGKSPYLKKVYQKYHVSN